MSTTTKCFWPNGQEVTKYNYQPCNAGADPTHAACCDLRTSVCTENGYCIGNANYVYRGGCTDSTWTSSSCAQECSFAVEADLTDFANIFNCDAATAMATNDQQWCCGKTDGTSCCDNKFKVAFGRPYSPTNGTSTSSTTTATTTVTVSQSATGTSLSDAASTSPASTISKSGTDTRAIGIGVGVGVGIAALILILTVFYMLKERKKRLLVEQQLRAAVGGGSSHGPRELRQRQEMEQPEYDVTKQMHRRVHEINTQSLYEVQG